MAEESILTDDLIRQLINVGEVDLLVGLPTHNNAETVGGVVQAIQAGILKCFPRERTAILNVDAGSKDGTSDVVMAASINDLRRAYNNTYALRTLPSLTTRYASSPSSETSLHTILAASDLLRAKACVVISPESVNIQPEWLDALLRPVYRGAIEFVAPIYRRPKFEGMLVSNVVYPMMFALYGMNIREPYPADFGFSAQFGNEFLAQHSWHGEAGQFGTELEMVLSAIAGRRRISQTFLGTKSRSEQHPADLVAAMRQTVGVLFASMDVKSPDWTTSHGITDLPTRGPEYEITLEPVRVNKKRLSQMFSSGVSELAPVLQSILTPPTLDALRQIARLDGDTFRYPAELWARTVYEFAASHHKSVMSRDHIVQALVPLYRGRALTFLMENRVASAEEVEANIEALCHEFERLKPYLVDLWHGGK